MTRAGAFRARPTGASLVEVLVALLVVAAGALGLVGLQIVSAQNNRAALQRSLATLLAGDMLERIRANPDAHGGGHQQLQQRETPPPAGWTPEAPVGGRLVETPRLGVGAARIGPTTTSGRGQRPPHRQRFALLFGGRAGVLRGIGLPGRVGSCGGRGVCAANANAPARARRVRIGATLGHIRPRITTSPGRTPCQDTVTVASPSRCATAPSPAGKPGCLSSGGVRP